LSQGDHDPLTPDYSRYFNKSGSADDQVRFRVRARVRVRVRVRIWVRVRVNWTV
jgi:hypothetical protein